MSQNEGENGDSDHSGASFNTVKEGWLWKKHQKAQLWTGWHKRYFVLTRDENAFVYYKSQGTTKVSGKILLGQESNVEYRGKKNATIRAQREEELERFELERLELEELEAEEAALQEKEARELQMRAEKALQEEKIY